MAAGLNPIQYYLSEHPSIVTFRWSHSQSWGATWSFLFTSISLYLLLSSAVHLLLAAVLRRGRAVPLGPIPAAHSLAMALVSAATFAGTLLSAAAEIRETRWFWRRSKTPLQWLLCFPLGTRSSGRVFFWSYVYYLSRFLHMLRSLAAVARRRKLPYFQLINNSVQAIVSFLWLEFSQSFQIIAILMSTLVYSVVYGYRFWTAVGLPAADFPVVVNFQVLLLFCNFACNVGVFVLHFMKGGCNGIGAWCLNSVLNGAILVMFLRFYVKVHLRKKKKRKELQKVED